MIVVDVVRTRMVYTLIFDSTGRDRELQGLHESKRGLVSSMADVDASLPCSRERSFRTVRRDGSLRSSRVV